MDGETVHQPQYATLSRVVVDDEADLRSPPGAASAGPPTRDTERSPLLARTERSPLWARTERSPLRARGHEKPPAPDRHDLQPFDHPDDPGRREFDRQSHDSGQAGVKRLEAIASTWSKEALYLAYLGIALMTCATSLESQTTTNLTVYATSSFSAHALISTVLVVQGVVLSVVKPPMSKVADVFGRVEAFGLSIGLCVAGYVQQAAAHNVESYAAAQIFYAAGQTGLQILIQIFLADTSDLLNRALVVTLPDVPFLVNVWVGPVLAEGVLEHLTWRWGYGLWAIVLPLAFLPLGVTLWTAQRRAARRGALPPSPLAGKTRWQAARSLWWEMDAFGLLMLCVGFSLLLIPLTVGADRGWRDPGFVVMLIVGACCIVGFPFFERNQLWAPRAFFPRALFKNRTALAGIAWAFFYFGAFYLSVFPYFQSYLLVVHGLSVAAAGHVIQIFTFSATITSIVVSCGIKYWGRYRPFVLAGIVLYLLGLIAMVFLRTEHASLRSIVAAQILIGVGGGMAHGPAQLGVQASASHSEVAAATAGFLTLLEIGGAVGSAISGAIWSGDMPDLLERYLPDETKDQAAAIYGSVKLASTGWPLGSPTRTAINHAYQDTMTKILLVAVGMATPCLVLTLLMKDYRLHEIDQHVTGVVIGSTAPPAADHDAADHDGGGSSAAAPLLTPDRVDERD